MTVGENEKHDETERNCKIIKLNMNNILKLKTAHNRQTNNIFRERHGTHYNLNFSIFVICYYYHHLFDCLSKYNGNSLVICTCVVIRYVCKEKNSEQKLIECESSVTLIFYVSIVIRLSVCFTTTDKCSIYRINQMRQTVLMKKKKNYDSLLY